MGNVGGVGCETLSTEGKFYLVRMPEGNPEQDWNELAVAATAPLLGAGGRMHDQEKVAKRRL